MKNKTIQSWVSHKAVKETRTYRNIIIQLFQILHRYKETRLEQSYII